MKRVLVFAIAALLVLPLAAGAQEKWVRGEVTAVTGNSFTVKAADGAMTFAIDASTDIVAPGGATATREARKLGAEGTTLDKVIKVGDMVEVHYKEAAGVMTATEIRAGISVPAGGAVSAPTGSAKGAVAAVGADSITVKGEKEWTFKVDSKTVVIGRGVGTMTKQLKDQGKAPTITDLVGVGDTVIVSFKEAGGAMQAHEIRIATKAPK